MRQINVMAEYGLTTVGISHLPLWEDGKLIEDDRIHIPALLRRDLIEWNDEYDAKQIDATVTPEFVRSGRELAKQIKAFLGAEVVVTYYNDLTEDKEHIT